MLAEELGCDYVQGDYLGEPGEEDVDLPIGESVQVDGDGSN